MAISKRLQLLALAAVSLMGVIVAIPPAGATGTSRHAPMQLVTPPGPGVAQSATTVRSSNWSGYYTTGSTYTNVSASWVQPTVTCNSTKTYSAFWVGLDGVGDSTVEQTGTEADCLHGSPSYSGWYEMYPKYPVNFNFAVDPGDEMSGSVTATTTDTFTLTLTDTTRGWTESIAKSLPSAERGSAEVIAEAPSSLVRVLPLSDFGTVSFKHAEVDGQNIGDVAPVAIDMGTKTYLKATTSALSKGKNFRVSWDHS